MSIRNTTDTIKQNLSFWRGVLKEAKQIPNSDGFGIITMSVDNRVLEGDSVPQIPTLYPYGMMSVPVSNSDIVGGFLTGTYQNPFGLGILPAFVDTDVRLTGLAVGESVVYSTKYAVRVENGGCFFSSQSANTYETPAVIGEWMKKIQIDIIEELKEIVNTFQAQIKSTFDTHVHTSTLPTTPTSIPTTSFPTSSFPQDLTDDLEALEDNKIFVTDTGEPP